jgi:hypothetical protein
MSHFTVLVFGKEKEVDALLAPYDENIEVEEYLAETVSNDDKQRFVDFYIEKDEENSEVTFDDLYSKYGNDWNGNSWRKDENGAWRSYSTYNPLSKWDWYAIGGRWDNAIRNNQCLVKTIPDDFIPFAFVDQFGKWHERAEMGWWAITSNDKDENDWKEEFKTALNNYTGYVTLVDCHI